MDTDTYTQEIAKATLRDALSTHAGDLQNQAVVAAIETLVPLNPTPSPAYNSTLRDGHWLLINAPNFPGGDRQPDGRMLYTLGRLAFNMFEPKGLKVQIDRVLQPVLPIENSSQHTHDIIVEFTTVDTDYPPLQGIVYNSGVCEPGGEDVIRVQFTGGTLVPQPYTDLQAWTAVFGQQSSHSKTAFKEKMTELVLKVMFGLRAAEGMEPQTGKVTFTMARSPKGKLQILYLDQELRITKGEKGTVLVCERQQT